MSQPIRFACPPTAGRLALLVALSAFFTPLTPVSAQCTLICNQNLSISLNTAGQASISTQLLVPNAASSCPGPLELKLFTAQGVPVTNPLNCNNIGQVITATVRHLASGNSCSGSIEVQDALSPLLACPDKTVLCNQDASVAGVGLPTMSDNCTPSGSLNYQFIDQETNLGCSGTHAGYPVIRRIDRAWAVTDQHGNSSTCVQKIWLRRSTAANVVFPPNRDGFALPALVCGQDPEDLALTGQPLVGGQPIDNGGFCELGVSYSDQIINYCPPAAYTVVRTWVLVEFCTSTVMQRIQLIKVEDKTAPVVTAPANLSVGTSGSNCSAVVTLPATTAIDNCSAVTIAPTWAYGTGYGPFAGVVPGNHVVTYVATDACGNSATTTALVTVVDNSPPTAFCKSSLQVALTSSGTAGVQAAALDAGSFDNCSAVSLAASRDDLNYSASVTVNCTDIGAPVMITLRTTDAVGLENFCTMELSVRDFLKPVLLCPANVTLTCQQDYRALAVTGQAAASDNCSLQSLDSTNVVSLDGCHIGAVTRFWKATDAAGNTRLCTQNIVLAPINTMTVVFPPNVVVNGCSTAATAPATTGLPVITGQSCFPPSVTYTDQIFQVAPPACFRIVRTWEVIDFCIHTPNNGTTGYWQYAQVVDVRDTAAPVLSIPADLTVSPNQPGCLAQVNLSDASATDCSGTVTITHNSAFAASGANASGLYPPGLHSITYNASDGCGNLTQRTLHLTVQDISPPAAVCINGLAVNIASNGVVAIPPALLNGGSQDNCSAAAELFFSTSPVAFTCQQIGYQSVVLTVTDAAGNTSTCQTLVHVQDNANICSGLQHDISGTIRTPVGYSVAEIPVRLAGDGFVETVSCDSAGQFGFSDVPAGAYTLTPANNAKWLNGVSTYDLVLISRHILGLQALSSPYKILAADANRSGSVTTFDIVQLRKLILGILDTLPGSTSWRFLPANYVFTDTLNPFVSALPEAIVFPNLTGDRTNQDFFGIKLGDLNGNTNLLDPRSPPDTAWVEIPDLWLLPNVPVAVPLGLKKWSVLSGFQFEITFDAAIVGLDEVELLPGNPLRANHLAPFNHQRLAVSWDDGQDRPAPHDSALLVLHLLPKRAASLRSAVRLHVGQVVPESYSTNRVGIAPLDLRFSPSPEATLPAGPPTWQFVPNPFSDATTLVFDLPEPGDVQLVIADAIGRTVLSRKAGFPAGRHYWPISGEDLPATGVYRCRLSTPTQTFTGGALIFMR